MISGHINIVRNVKYLVVFLFVFNAMGCSQVSKTSGLLSQSSSTSGSSSSSGGTTVSNNCSCSGTAYGGAPVFSSVCGSTICGTDSTIWTCTVSGYSGLGPSCSSSPGPTPGPTGKPDSPPQATKLSVPAVITSSGHQNDPLVFAGYLDVTLYGADPKGQKDSTSAIQNAMNDAAKYSMITYVPSGTYLISDTLVGEEIEGSLKNYGYGTVVGNQIKGPTLVGPASGPRPTIQLIDGSSGFNSASGPKAMVWFYYINPDHSNSPPSGCNDTSVAAGASDCLFNAVIRDINFTTGNNPGAIGVQFYSAQQSYMENVSVNATGGFSGVDGAPTTSDWVNISITGGKYGLSIDGGSGGENSIIGLTLSGQTTAGIFIGNDVIGNSTNGDTSIVGFNFQENGVPAVMLTADYNGYNSMTTFTLIDGIIKINGGSQPAILNPYGISLYLNNVYMQAPTKLITNGSATVSASGSLDLMNEYGHADTTLSNWNAITTYNVVNNSSSQTDYKSLTANAGTPPTDLLTRHLPTPNGQLPWAFDSDAVWATDYGADPTGFSDSTAAIQNAINASNKVFLPRGDYNVSGTIQLKPDTVLFGVPSYFTRIVTDKWVTHGVLQPVIRTANSATGKTYIGDIHINLTNANSCVTNYSSTVPCDSTYISGIDWQTGRNSVGDQVYIDLPWVNTPLDVNGNNVEGPSAARNFIHFYNNGGGQFYGLQMASWQTATLALNPNFHMLEIDGTTQPISIYGSNPEHHPESFYKINSASNIRVLGIKAENSVSIIDATNSSNIMVAGMTDHGDAANGVVDLNGCSNVSLGNLSWYGESAANEHLVNDGNLYSQDAYSVFKLGSFNQAAFPYCGDGYCGGGEDSNSCPQDCGG
jgi:hypothetical protein